MPWTSIAMSALMLSTLLPSYSTVPVTRPSVPRTVDTIMCLTLNCAAVWAESTSHWLGPSAGRCGRGAAAAGEAGGVCAVPSASTEAAAARVRVANRTDKRFMREYLQKSRQLNPAHAGNAKTLEATPPFQGFLAVPSGAYRSRR